MATPLSGDSRGARTLLESLYLDPAQAGVPWLLDPDNPDVADGLRRASKRKPSDVCDPAALSADVPDLLTLLRERHFGLATGEVDGARLGEWAAIWQERLDTDRPATWGAALGTDILRLRYLLHDGHLQAHGEDPARLTKLAPRHSEPTALDTDGPIVEEHIVDGVLALRIRHFHGTTDEDRILNNWASDHRRHFRFDRIVLDLRSNGGGRDTYCGDWMADHLPVAAKVVPDSRSWLLDGKYLRMWNTVVAMAAAHGHDAVPDWLVESRPQPAPESDLTVEAGTDNHMPAGGSPWRGHMLVITDRHTGSAGESSAWMLREGLGARVAGRPTAGTVRFANTAPYLLPRSGLALILPARSNDYPRAMELAGMPVDINLNPLIPLADVAADFNRIWSQADAVAA
jgi:hypothetical protein